MKSLYECQEVAWATLQGSVRAVGDDVPDRFRGAVNMMVAELYTTLQGPSKSRTDAKLGDVRRKLARAAVPLIMLGTLWVGVQLGKGKDLSDMFTWVFFLGVAAVTWYLAEYGLKGSKRE
jgi:hypothetical protein